MTSTESLFIGSRIRIISKANIRYEGNLFSLRADENNDPVLTLSKVTSYGTEDRPCDRPVLPRSEIYEQIAFRGRDLVDLTIIKQQQQPFQLNDDPSIVSAELEASPLSKAKPREDGDAAGLWGGSSVFSDIKKIEPSGEKQTGGPAFMSNFMSPKPPADLLSDIPTAPWGAVGGRPNTEGDRASNTASTSGAGVKDLLETASANFGKASGSGVSRQEEPRRDVQRQRGGGGGGGRGFRPSYNNNQRYGPRPNNDNYRSNQSYNPRGGYNQRPRNYNAPLGPKVDFKEDYDIEKANAELAEELEKIEISSTSQAGSEHGEAEPKPEEKDTYDSNKSFFDTLSSEIMDRAQGVVNRRSHREDRRQNFDTFGPAANRMGGPYRGGGGYRGRRGGGYRGYRGGGGGYGGQRYRNNQGQQQQQQVNNQVESATS